MKNTHEFYMRIAGVVSLQSYAVRRKVGCILVKDNNIISFGYNGTPYGFDNTCETTDVRGILVTIPEVLHAESNAITKCAKNGINSDGSILYTTLAPCVECSKLLLQAGISKVYYKDYYDSAGERFLSSVGIFSTQVFP